MIARRIPGTRLPNAPMTRTGTIAGTELNGGTAKDQEPSAPTWVALTTYWATVSSVWGALAVYSAWSFGRGLVSALKLPPSAGSFLSALDRYPAVGSASATAFACLVVGGAAVGVKASPKASKASEGAAVVAIGALFVGCLHFYLPIPPSGRLAIAHLGTALVAPILLGYLARLCTDGRLQAWIGICALALSLDVLSSGLCEYGRYEAGRLMKTPASLAPDHGMLAFLTDEYPLLQQLVSTRDLSLGSHHNEGTTFIYSYDQASDSSIRLLFSDADRYCLFVRVAGQGRVISVAKSEIPVMLFRME
jgi:hypothetical protein